MPLIVFQRNNINCQFHHIQLKKNSVNKYLFGNLLLVKFHLRFVGVIFYFTVIFQILSEY